MPETLTAARLVVDELESRDGVWLDVQRGSRRAPSPSDLAVYDICNPAKPYQGVTFRVEGMSDDITVTVVAEAYDRTYRRVIPSGQEPQRTLADLRAELDMYGATPGKPRGKTLRELVA
jgi:hypothetical protein